MAGYGKTAAKVLELLATGFLLGFAKGRDGKRKLWQQCDEVWYSIDRKTLDQILRRFKLQGHVEVSSAKNGGEIIELTPLGRSRFLQYKFEGLSIPKPQKWDKKWRLVLFDIPESRRKIRNALRKKLKDLDFLEFQKSAFLFPYSCEDEINFVINVLDIAENVHYVEAAITPDAVFRSKFEL